MITREILIQLIWIVICAQSVVAVIDLMMHNEWSLSFARRVSPFLIATSLILLTLIGIGVK